MRLLRHVATYAFGIALLAGFARSEDCQLAMPRPGHAYYTGEPVQFAATVTGPRQQIQYAVTDDRGLLMRTGTAILGLGRTLELSVPGALPPGWYRLRLWGSSVAIEEAFCVIPRPWEEPGDYQLFALHPDDWSEASLQAAAQIGVRQIRHNILWPNTEPQRGKWDWEYIRQGYEWAQRSGQQMLVVLGYTPGFLAQRAENCHLWIEKAQFTWHPREPDEFARYAQNVMSYARDRMVRWPPTAIMPRGETAAPETVPWICGWEVWNEVDLVYYFGDWNRYCELLRLAYAYSRKNNPDTPVLFGGSTGNWPAMNRLISGAGRYTYDYNTFHPDEEISNELSQFYSGAPQLPYCVGLPRETIHTESYSTGREAKQEGFKYHETPEDLLRLYVILKAWREVGYYRSGCLGGWIDDGQRLGPGRALLVKTASGLRPTPLYPAFAATRKLLSDATPVGPVKLDEQVIAYAFLKAGRTMLVAWSDSGAEVVLELEPGAYRVDPMGRQFSLEGRRRYRYHLTAAPLVIIGAKSSAYLGQALRQEYALRAETYHGSPPWPGCWVWYTGQLQDDLAAVVGTAGPVRLKTAIREAARALAQKYDGDEMAEAQAMVHELMARLAERAGGEEGLQPQVTNTLWRLARMAEWLGQVTDATSPEVRTTAATHSAYTETQQQLNAAQTMALETHPFSERLMHRAHLDLLAGPERTGAGVVTTARQKIRLAERLRTYEPGVVLNVVPLLDFTTARLLRKAVLLEPGREHRLRVWVHNLRLQAVRGTLTLCFPELWKPSEVTVGFSAPAESPSKPVELTVEVPGTPLPWVRRTSFTLDGDLLVELPTSLPDVTYLTVSGQLREGSKIPAVHYHLNLGREISATESASNPLQDVTFKQRLNQSSD